MRIRVAWLGKTKYASTRAWTEEYLKRLRGFGRGVTVEGEELAGKQPEEALLRRAAGARLWLLEPGGRSFTSEGFAAFLEEQAAKFGQELVMAVGGADGFGAAATERADGRISLSPLVLSHELARVVLLEQIYRACAILHHHPYPH